MLGAIIIDMNQQLNISTILIIILLFFTSLNSFGQDKDTSLTSKFEVWKQRINIGFSLGYPTIPFIDLGFKFYDKVYLDMFIEPGETKKYSMFFDIGYQKNNLFHKNLCGQIGLSLMQVADKNETTKYNKPGINVKLIKPLSKRFGFFTSSHLGYPDTRIDYEKLVNVNVGIDIYFRQVPLLMY